MEKRSTKEITVRGGGAEVDERKCVLMVVVVVVVEGGEGAEAWQTAKRIKYRSTTKAVSQGRLSHKSPFESPSSATHLFPRRPVPLTSCYHDSALPQRQPLI